MADMISLQHLKADWYMAENEDVKKAYINIAIIKNNKDGSRDVIQPDGTIGHVPNEQRLEDHCTPTVKVPYMEFIKLKEKQHEIIN